MKSELCLHRLIYPNKVGKLVPAEVVREQRVVISHMKRPVLQKPENIAPSRYASDLLRRTVPTGWGTLVCKSRSKFHNQEGQMNNGPYPPFNQMPHGSVLDPASAVKESFCVSQAQKNSVSLGWSGRSTGMFPAQLRPTGNVRLGSDCVTWKSGSRQSA